MPGAAGIAPVYHYGGGMSAARRVGGCGVLSLGWAVQMGNSFFGGSFASGAFIGQGGTYRIIITLGVREGGWFLASGAGRYHILYLSALKTTISYLMHSLMIPTKSQLVRD